MAPGGGGNIKVVVRCRPFNSRERDRGAQCIVQMKGTQTVLIPPAGHHTENPGARKGTVSKDSGPKVFNFDRSYWSFDKSDPSYAGQENLFEDLGQPLLDNAFAGYNNCIFAYGQTGSGKSYSMMGYGPEAGVVPQICQHLFERINAATKSDPNVQHTVEVSYLEIYNERVRDLLNPSTKGGLKVREHPSLGPYVEDLAKLVVGSFAEIENLMDEGNKARTVAATNMNETSSRSHAVFTLILTQKRHDAETNMDTEKVSRISLVDLAGSERANSTGATGARLKEGAEINRSLSTLGRVIAALADLSSAKGKKGAKNMVPYRDSVLTWLLKDSLGGNSMTAMIAAISPADINFDETLSTLRYADSAKRIKNHAVVNEDPNARMIRELKEELQQLRAKLSGGAGTIEEERYDASVPLEKQIVSITASDGTVRKVSKAEIAEQLQSSEKLFTEINQSWEEKLEKTQQIHKEREAALEELGISIEKGFIGMSTPKKIPHLVNLSDDPLLAECLVYNIRPGTTTVGNVETSTTAQIRLNGSKILTEHCRFENENGVVTLIPNEGAPVMVNGLGVDKARRLRSGFRIILGDFHIFRFNNPQEARAERDKLRQSVLASPNHGPSPSMGGLSQEGEREGEENGDGRPESPVPGSINGKEVDWSFARREAAATWLGADPKIAALSDEELDNLLEEMQRIRYMRRRPESTMDDDLESVTSYPGGRGKYMSNGTLDDMSLDTILTMPSTPGPSEVEERLAAVKEEMQEQLEETKKEYEDKLKAAEEAHVEIVEIRAEKQRMEEQLAVAKAEMEKELEKQRIEFESRLEEITLSPPKSRDPVAEVLTERAKSLAKWVMGHWKQRKYVRMAEDIFQHAALLKEAQIMSNEMEKQVVFQFTIVDLGHTLASTYDLVLNGISTEEMDEYLDQAAKPCVGVRVMDFKNEVVHLWSLQKLEIRVKQMRQLYQYLDRPEYLQHFRLGDPFTEPELPQYSLVGEADVPLTAVFESRSQSYTLDVFSPHTSSVVGIIKLSLEPSEAVTQSSTLKFNIILHELQGFAEREGSSVHAQLFVPGVSDESGATTTHMVTGFDEGPVKFDSMHSISVPLGQPLRFSTLRVAIFARITSTHIEKLISWDDMRDHNAAGAMFRKKTARIAETEFYSEERHDVMARVQILELAETGEYLPVDVIQNSDTDVGCFQLHQGIQRRVQLSLSHSSGETLPWKDISQMQIGRVRLLDPRGKIPDQTSATKEITLNTVLGPIVKSNADGTSAITIVAQWDSSLHNSILLDRTTAAGYRVQMCLKWSVESPKVSEPMEFSMEVYSQIQSRLVRSSSSKLMQMWNGTRIVRAATGVFSLNIRPAAARRAGDLWRMNTSHRYVKGEEYLGGWTPRGVSLVHDFIRTRKRRHRVAEVEDARGYLQIVEKQQSQKAAAATNGSAPTDSKDTPTDPLIGVETIETEQLVERADGNGPIETEAETETGETPINPSDLPGTTRPMADSINESREAESQDDLNLEPRTQTNEVTGNGNIDPTTLLPKELPNQADDEASSSSVTAPPQSDEQSHQNADLEVPADASTILAPPNSEIVTSSEPQPSHQDELIQKFLGYWSSQKDPSELILSQTNTEPPVQGAAFAAIPASPSTVPRVVAEVKQVPKATEILKSGQLLMPDPTNRYWVKRHFELRSPYLHVYSLPEMEHVMAININSCRIDHQPHVAKLLRRANIWAVYGRVNTYLFAARNQTEMVEWIMKIDQSYFGGNPRDEGAR